MCITLSIYIHVCIYIYVYAACNHMIVSCSMSYAAIKQYVVESSGSGGGLLRGVIDCLVYTFSVDSACKAYEFICSAY